MRLDANPPAIDPNFIYTNLRRCRRWHGGPEGIYEWSLADWNQAVTGEWGEANNAAKKLQRIQDGIKNRNNSDDPDEADRLITDKETAIAKIMEEYADTFIYLTIAAYVASGDPNGLSNAVRDKFNKTSETYDFPERW